MNSKCVATVISISPGINTIVSKALSLLNSVSQDVFAFEMGGRIELPPSATPETPRLWSELECLLTEERQRRKCELLLGVLNEPIENNWFSHSVYGKGVAWITAHDWEFYSNLPVVSFVAYDIVLNVVLMRVVAKPEDESWLMREVLHTQESRACISDLCAYKPDVSGKIRSGKICPDCRKILEARLGIEVVAAVDALLQGISRTAQPSVPTSSIGDFPVLRQMRKEATGFLRKAEALKQRSEAGNWDAKKSEMELKQKAIEKEQQQNSNRITKPAAKMGMSESTRRVQERVFCYAPLAAAREPALDRPGLAEEVERRYPFPIAYCFRSMRAELSPTDRWDVLFELYGLIVRYLVFALVSAFRHGGATCPEELKPLVQKLKFGFAGDWGRACMALLKFWGRADMDSFFKAFLVTLNAEKLRKFETASKAIVRTRNTWEHGYKGDRQECQKFYQRHVPDVKSMLEFIEPLADYVLIRPVQVLENVDGRCIYFSKIMAGSDPQFLPQQMVASSVPETVCQLLGPDGGTLTLHPWLHLNRCDSCLREMVFVYDAVHMRDGQEAVVLREYPSNHEQRQPALVRRVKELLYV
jgi:hypothetical protein